MRASRRFLAVALGLSIIASGALTITAATFELAPVDVTGATPTQPVSLRDRLIVGLQARLKSEIAFCNTVAIQVQLGNLPLRMVDETFLWARQRASPAVNGLEYRPIIYFQPAMKLRARRLRIELQQ